MICNDDVYEYPDDFIDVIVEYISNCHQNIISVGWKNKEMEVEKFKKMTINNLTLLYDNYFNY